ncbi:hypothetical protein ACGFJ5_11525 [Micromonospora echinaurantiaca]|uniref:hypothetical protein n=1 Tax=Micromonospora echinaurantiaca TaxID=47857 RepID=UPI0037169FC2
MGPPPDAAGYQPDPGVTHLGLADGGRWIGLCRVDPLRRHIDGPGVVPGYRHPRHYARLLAAACALLGPGPAELESWGDEPGVLAGYRQAGFLDVERVDGWELVLPASRSAAADQGPDV